jgi:hypothetical protein
VISYKQFSKLSDSEIVELNSNPFYGLEIEEPAQVLRAVGQRDPLYNQTSFVIFVENPDTTARFLGIAFVRELEAAPNIEIEAIVSSGTKYGLRWFPLEAKKVLLGISSQLKVDLIQKILNETSKVLSLSKPSICLVTDEHGGFLFENFEENGFEAKGEFQPLPWVSKLKMWKIPTKSI